MNLMKLGIFFFNFTYLLRIIFGAICIICGIIGTFLGSELSNRFRKWTNNSETYICAIALLLCSICCYFSVVINFYSIEVSWVFNQYHY